MSWALDVPFGPHRAGGLRLDAGTFTSTLEPGQLLGTAAAPKKRIVQAWASLNRLDFVPPPGRLIRAVAGFLAAGMGVGLLVGAVFGDESLASRLAYVLASACLLSVIWAR